MRRSLLLILMLILCFPVSAGAFKIAGLKTPESFIVDPSTGLYYVSNINGPPTGKDNNGFIARLDVKNKRIDLHFIRPDKSGGVLNAPKGLAILKNELYVTDIDSVRRYDKKTGKYLGTIDFSLLGAKFLNDLAVGPNGVLFVSDTAGNTIYKIDTAHKHTVSILAKNPGLGGPNGLKYDPRHKRLVVVTWGTGQVLGVDMQGKLIHLLPRKFKNLDGVDFDQNGDVIFSDFKKGAIYRMKNYRTVETIQENLVTPADISYDYRNHQVLVPSFNGNLVFTLPLKK